MKYLTLIAFLFIAHMNYGQQISATYSKSTISTECWSNNHVVATPTQQNSLAIFENYVYTVYYNADRYLCVSRSDNYGKNSWKTVVLSHRYEKRNGKYDNHNTPNIAISPSDKRIHLSFDMHARDLRYMISVENLAVADDSVFTADKFSAVRNYLTENKTAVKQVTYPRFIIGKDSTLLFSYRGEGGSGNANSFLVTYKDNGYWNTPLKIVNGKTGTYKGAAGTSSTRCAYFNDFVCKSGVLYLTWMWRETPDLITNHDLMFAYSEDNGTTWKNTNNLPMSKPLHLNSSGLKVATILQNSGMINHNGCAVDGSGNVHAVVRIGSSYKHDYRLGTKWKSQIINTGGFVGDRPKVYCDRTTNTLYLVVRRGAEVRLFGSVPNGDKWDSWTRLAGVNDSYMAATNSFISPDGKTLRTMAVTSDNELHLISWNLTNTSPQTDSLYTLNVIAENGVVTKNTDADKFAAHTKVELTAIADEGYEFESWLGDLSGTDNPATVTMLTNLNIEANFSIISAVESVKQAGISISPNPNSGTFIIRMNNNEKATYTVYSLTGKQIQNGSFMGETSVELNESLNGLYIVEISSNNSLSRHKVIISQ